MYGGTHSKRACFRQTLSGLFIVVILCQYLGPLSDLFIPKKVEAAQATIDASVSTVSTSHLQSGTQTVFVNDQTGYKFYRDSGGNCVYSKTTDGGTNWGAPVTVDAQTDCIGIQVWYDKWTPGLPVASSSIHIMTADTSADDLFYNRLDTTNDSLLLGTTPVSMVGAQGGSLTEGENYGDLVRGSDGTIYAISNDGSNPTADSYIVECTVSCQTAGNWSETGINPLDAASDFNILVPLAGGNIMIINRDISADDIRTKIWNNVAWSAAWTAVDANAPENATYDIGMAAAVSSTTAGTVYLAYIANNATLGTDDVIRAAKYSGSTWSTVTGPLTSTTRGLTNVALGLDAANDNVYVAYSGRTTAGTANTGEVYWKWASSSMMNWSVETGPINASADDFYGVDINLASDQRLYASWYDTTDDDIYGDTIADIYPGIHASSSGNQTATVNASTTNFFIGGGFLIYNTRLVNFDVTGITLTESGTVDGSTDLSNIKLLYETDTTYPYDCQSVSYNGNEAQFGSTDTNGFSGANGTSAFTGTTVNLSTTTALCVYPVMDVLNSAANNETIDISINNPSTDITVTGSTPEQTTAENISGTTAILNDMPTQSHFHWRNDDGTETTATSKTGGTEDTALNALQQNSPIRLRFEVSNEGGSTTPATQYRLEYAQTAGACSSVSSWTDVGAAGGDFDMYDSPNLTDGNNTTDISIASGGMTNENTSFQGTNGAVKDTSSQTSGFTLSSTQYVDLEYSIKASTTAVTGNRYCFRLSDAGNSLFTYSAYPTATINPDVQVGILSASQTTATTVPATNFYVGTGFKIVENLSSRNVTSITIAESGTVDAQNDLDNIKLRYDLDTTAPYDCVGETYSGSESQFGSTDTDGFSWANGSSTFTGSVAISTTQTMCVYPVLDVVDTALDAQTVNILMTAPATDVVVSGGGYISPTSTLDLNGSTTLVGPILTQSHYHWRKDNGSEVGATSATYGLEDTAVSNISLSTPMRLRLEMSNEGLATSSARTYRLEYGTKVTNCSAVTFWTDVGAAGGDFDMYDSPSITEGNNTTNISVASGGTTDENTTFKTSNAAVKDTSSSISSLTLTPAEFLEAEFSLKQTSNASYDTTYCFRLTAAGTALPVYSKYPELTTSPERDFEIQRGTVTISGTSATLTAGVDYVAPAASTSAFIRITNTHSTGAGSTAGGTQNADDVTAYIVNPSNILNSITIGRPSTATGDTRVSWEIIEFVGETGGDNEMKVRSQTSVTYGTSALVATGTAASGVVNDSDVVVFVTGQLNPDTGTQRYNLGQSTSAWGSVSDVPVFTRGETGSSSIVSYAVVEFTGPNWNIQRVEHIYTATGTTETEPITAVNSLSRTFLHTQKRSGTGLNGTDEFGHEVWLSSIGFVSFVLETDATTPSAQSSVAWVIENTQTNTGAMDVTRSNGTSNGGATPFTLSVGIGKTLTDLTNASIFANSRSAGNGQIFPRPIAGMTIASSTHYELWRSNTGANLTYRTEIVEWPTASLALKQNYYRFYVDNNALDPTDPWPSGAVDLGENTVLTTSDEPLGSGERIRLRMTVKAVNATFPTTTKSFRLQYAPLTTTCSAIPDGNWHALGDTSSTTQWRGYNAAGTTDGTVLSTDPPVAGDLNISVSDVAGTLEEINDSVANPYVVNEGEDVEYDWIMEQNDANADTYYCFRMVQSDNTNLDAYLQYPELRTAPFTARTQNWRWYDDEMHATPTTTLGVENAAPINITNGQQLALRVTVKEIENTAQDNTRFKLQYSEYADFSVPHDVVATTSCTASSTWCYADGGGADNGVIPTKTLSDADACAGGVGDGCGTYNESPSALTGYRHENSAAAEYSFTIQSNGPHVNTVYYFRLWNLIQNVAVPYNTGKSYPSLVTEGASLTSSLSGVASSTSVEGIITDVATTPTAISYGRLPINTDIEAAHRLQVTTDAPQGYQLYMTTTSDLINSSGDTIGGVTGTNASPSAWAVGCSGSAVGCFGYHAGDDTLEGGSTRFAPTDTYAKFSTTTLQEIGYYSGPVTNDTIDMVYRLKARSLQEAGQYTTSIRYITVPVF